jgi:hypothetical protein
MGTSPLVEVATNFPDSVSLFAFSDIFVLILCSGFIEISYATFWFSLLTTARVEEALQVVFVKLQPLRVSLRSRFEKSNDPLVQELTHVLGSHVLIVFFFLWLKLSLKPGCLSLTNVGNSVKAELENITWMLTEDDAGNLLEEVYSIALTKIIFRIFERLLVPGPTGRRHCSPQKEKNE